MQYHSVDPISQTEAEDMLNSGNSVQIVDALLRSAFHDPDWHWVQTQALEYVHHASLEVQLMAVLCFGHLARIHGTLDLDLVMPVLRKLADDPQLSGRVEDVLDDIQMFIGH